MSAYICYPSHIGLLAAAYDEGNKFVIPEQRREKARKIAEILAQQNIDSVIARYPTSEDGRRPGPCFVNGKGNDQAIIDLSVLWADHYASKKIAALPIEIIKLAHCLDYQSCETKNYELTDAAKLIQQIIYAQTRKLAGYEQASGEWSDQAAPKSIITFLEDLQGVEQ